MMHCYYRTTRPVTTRSLLTIPQYFTRRVHKSYTMQNFIYFSSTYIVEYCAVFNVIKSRKASGMVHTRCDWEKNHIPQVQSEGNVDFLKVKSKSFVTILVCAIHDISLLHCNCFSILKKIEVTSDILKCLDKFFHK